jgi:predicted Holliday junction resolvase-like endonuclease
MDPAVIIFVILVLAIWNACSRIIRNQMAIRAELEMARMEARAREERERILREADERRREARERRAECERTGEPYLGRFYKPAPAVAAQAKPSAVPGRA